jgi:hypothetical protein|tara:strand:- start:1247 stop:1402 length:156 start_codon:yes stop_codon:yes gene_type:complete
MEEEKNEFRITRVEMEEIANEWWNSLTNDEKELLFQEQMIANSNFIPSQEE